MIPTLGADWSEPWFLEQENGPGAGIPAAFGFRLRPSAGSPLAELQQRRPWARLYLQAWKGGEVVMVLKVESRPCGELALTTA